MSTKPHALLNLADSMAEDILNMPDDEVLREVEEDFGDPRALANKFDQILERAEKQVSGAARPAASPQPDETVRWVEGIFDLGSRLSEFVSSLTPRTLVWSATAAAVAILVPAVVIIKVWNEIEQGPPSASQMAGPPLPPLASFEALGGPPVATTPMAVTQAPAATSFEPTPKLSDEEIAALIARGRQLIVAGDIPNARLVLRQAAEASDATAALELGATYDPIELEKLDARDAIKPVASKRKALPDIAMARTWYQKAKDLGSTEAQGRLENLAGRDRPKR